MYRRPTEGIIYVRHLNQELKNKLKEVCLNRGLGMTEVMIGLMGFYLKKPEAVVVTKRNRDQGGSFLFFRVPDARVRQLFRGTCYRRGDSVADVIASLAKLYITNPEFMESMSKKEKAK